MEMLFTFVTTATGNMSEEIVTDLQVNREVREERPNYFSGLFNTQSDRVSPRTSNGSYDVCRPGRYSSLDDVRSGTDERVVQQSASERHCKRSCEDSCAKTKRVKIERNHERTDGGMASGACSTAYREGEVHSTPGSEYDITASVSTKDQTRGNKSTRNTCAGNNPSTNIDQPADWPQRVAGGKDKGRRTPTKQTYSQIPQSESPFDFIVRNIAPVSHCNDGHFSPEKVTSSNTEKEQKRGHSKTQVSVPVATDGGQTITDTNINNSSKTSRNEATPQRKDNTPIDNDLDELYGNADGSVEEPDDCYEDEDALNQEGLASLEGKVVDLVMALEPLKNISKALIAVDHHLRRLLPLLELLMPNEEGGAKTTTMHSNTDPRRKLNSTSA